MILTATYFPISLQESRLAFIQIYHHLIAFHRKLTPQTILTFSCPADDNLELTRELVQKEIDEGWVEPFDGTLGDAQQLWPDGVAIGKLGIALSDRRPPRLVVDSSICGLNARCKIPDQGTLPSIKDVMRCFPLRNNRYPLNCLSLDVKSAHKRIAVKFSERGLLGFTLDGRLFFYKVCPFGAVFSASWWGRLAGFLLRYVP